MTSFADSIDGADQKTITQLRQIIQREDASVSEKPGKIMSADDALCYLEDGVMKYGLAKTAKGFTFHSMVMYANPDIFDFTKTNLKNVKMQKGCFNITALDRLDIPVFKEIIRRSASKDFSPVIDHYQKRVRKRKT